MGSTRADMSAAFEIDREILARVCKAHGIRRLSLFGSSLRGTARLDSDVDLLVEFEDDAHPTLLDLAQIESELSTATGGRRVDLRTPEDLSRFFRSEVLETAEVQYVAR
jgi:predicted nucleotidyltransferase